MQRRNFLIGTLTAATAKLLSGQTSIDGVAMTSQPSRLDRTYHILGIPLRSGSFFPGNENDAQAYRDAHLLSRLQTAGCKAVEDGDLAIPSYLPHHSVPPIRSWPGPRIVWDLVSERLAPLLQQPGNIPLLIGCDCSIVAGTAQALMRANSEDIHVLYIDGDYDDAAPEPTHSMSAAASATWLLTNTSPFWSGPVLKPTQVTVIGWGNPSKSGSQVGSVPLDEVRKSGTGEIARKILDAIPASSPILLHFDVDVIRQEDLPTAYFPHTKGLSLSEASELLGVFLKDPRIRIIEITEYAALRDLNQAYVNKLIDLLVAGLKV